MVSDSGPPGPSHPFRIRRHPSFIAPAIILSMILGCCDAPALEAALCEWLNLVGSAASLSEAPRNGCMGEHPLLLAAATRSIQALDRPVFNCI